MGLRDLARRARGLLLRAGQLARFWRPGGYRAPAYWEARHKRFGFDRRGVGDRTRTDAENRSEYDEARTVFLGLCERDGIDLPGGRLLDIGCGTGFYCETYLQQGGRDYTGVDITDTLFPELERRYPGARFRRCDVTREELDGEFDVITMIDVTQHIVEDELFDSAMANVKRHLAKGGAAVLTGWLADAPTRRTLYEVERTRADYERALSGCELSEPVRFRDKWIFTVRPKS
jgi:SAM-dependent methyltransferase